MVEDTRHTDLVYCNNRDGLGQDIKNNLRPQTLLCFFVVVFLKVTHLFSLSCPHTLNRWRFGECEMNLREVLVKSQTGEQTQPPDHTE